jgi:hypothetical protein
VLLNNQEVGLTLPDQCCSVFGAPFAWRQQAAFVWLLIFSTLSVQVKKIKLILEGSNLFET